MFAHFDRGDKWHRDTRTNWVSVTLFRLWSIYNLNLTKVETKAGGSVCSYLSLSPSLIITHKSPENVCCPCMSTRVCPLITRHNHVTSATSSGCHSVCELMPSALVRPHTLIYMVILTKRHFVWAGHAHAHVNAHRWRWHCASSKHIAYLITLRVLLTCTLRGQIYFLIIYLEWDVMRATTGVGYKDMLPTWRKDDEYDDEVHTHTRWHKS